MMESVIKNCEKSIPCGYKYIEDGIYVEMVRIKAVV